MGRKEERIKNQIEKNPVKECNKIQKKYYPELFQKFSETSDPRNQSYITYTNKVMLGTMYYKGIAGIVSMQEMTENEYLERLDSEELEEIQQDIVYQMIRRKDFDDARFMKKWLVIIDGTQLYSGQRKLNKQCLRRCYNKGTQDEFTIYHRDVLEAKIYFGEHLVASLGSEFIENHSEDAKRQREMSAAEIKQDCETKAFLRLAQKIKKRFPRLPLILLADSLYASKPVMDLCAKYKWEYLIRYKKGSIPSIAEEYEAISEKERAGHAEYIKDIDYEGRRIHVLRFYEEKQAKGKIVRTEFQWLSSIRVTVKNAEKLAVAGRKRWKIENEGFNRQKNWQGDITHACSWNERAQKNHYLMLQISDFMKQLYEHYYLKKNEIKKKQKNISPELLASFGRQLTKGDIFTTVEMQGITTN